MNRQTSVKATAHPVTVDHSLSLPALAQAFGGEMLLVENFVGELPTTDRVEKVWATLLYTGRCGIYPSTPEEIEDIFRQVGMRTPTPREALSFAIQHKQMLQTHEVHVIGEGERHHQHLWMSKHGDEYSLFSYLWGNVPILSPSACLLAVRV